VPQRVCAACSIYEPSAILAQTCLHTSYTSSPFFSTRMPAGSGAGQQHGRSKVHAKLIQTKAMITTADSYLHTYTCVYVCMLPVITHIIPSNITHPFTYYQSCSDAIGPATLHYWPTHSTSDQASSVPLSGCCLLTPNAAGLQLYD
jgi:hypothetical protein